MKVMTALLGLLCVLGIALPSQAEKTSIKAPPIRIVLTFDDGPSATRKMGREDTFHVINTLKNNKTKPGIVGAFFVQTYMGRMNDNPTKPGTAAVLAAYKAGHVIGVHTGSTRDHVPHTIRVRQPAEDGNGDGVVNELDGSSGLASDLMRARRRVHNLTGENVLYVRAVGGSVNKAVFHTYAAQGWKYIRWNVDSDDNHPPRPSSEKIKGRLRSGVSLAIKGWHKPALIILFHDINTRTVTHLDEYIATIDKAVRATGHTPEFTTSRAQVDEVFQKNAEPLTTTKR